MFIICLRTSALGDMLLDNRRAEAPSLGLNAADQWLLLILCCYWLLPMIPQYDKESILGLQQVYNNLLNLADLPVFLASSVRLPLAH